MKTTEQYFLDWEHEVFGYGYGSGEYPIIRALASFFDLVTEAGSYDYRLLESQLTSPVAWLLLTILIKHGLLDYGTSPRYGFLTKEGKALRDFLKNKPVENTVMLVNDVTDDTTLCSPTHCNCDTDQPRCTALNPFWRKRRESNTVR